MEFYVEWQNRYIDMILRDADLLVKITLNPKQKNKLEKLRLKNKKNYTDAWYAMWETCKNSKERQTLNAYPPLKIES